MKRVVRSPKRRRTIDVWLEILQDNKERRFLNSFLRLHFYSPIYYIALHIYYKFRTNTSTFLHQFLYFQFFEKFYPKFFNRTTQNQFHFRISRIPNFTLSFKIQKFSRNRVISLKHAPLLDLLSETARFAAVYYSLGLLLARYNSKRSLNLILKIESLDYFKGPALRGAPSFPSLFYLRAG